MANSKKISGMVLIDSGRSTVSKRARLLILCAAVLLAVVGPCRLEATSVKAGMAGEEADASVAVRARGSRPAPTINDLRMDQQFALDELKAAFDAAAMAQCSQPDGTIDTRDPRYQALRDEYDAAVTATQKAYKGRDTRALACGTRRRRSSA
jgi:hypothetical protein